MSSRIPPLLESYLSLPSEASLILLTSVLGASTNWLVLRFLHSALVSSEIPDVVTPGEPKVLLLSFMRDLSFWKENSRKLGLDIDKLSAKKRFAFVDGLTGLYVPKQQRPSSARNGEKVLSSSALESVSGEIQLAIQGLRNGQASPKVLLVVDQLDLLLAASGHQIGAVDIEEMLMDLRESVHATIVTISADLPLVSAPHTPLETNHAAFLLNTAHQADFIMSLRLLDTGTARDVSGVVRVTVGNTAAEDAHDLRRSLGGKELLYFLGGDGGVKVFERGQ